MQSRLPNQSPCHLSLNFLTWMRTFFSLAMNLDEEVLSRLEAFSPLKLAQPTYSSKSNCADLVPKKEFSVTRKGSIHHSTAIDDIKESKVLFFSL